MFVSKVTSTFLNNTYQSSKNRNSWLARRHHLAFYCMFNEVFFFTFREMVVISSCVFVQCNNIINNTLLLLWLHRRKFQKARKGIILLQAIYRMRHQRQVFLRVSLAWHTHICILFHFGFVFIYIFLELQNFRKREHFFKNNKIYME